METCTNEQCDRLGEYHPSESMRSSTGCGLLRMRPHPPALSGDFSLRSQHEKIIADRGSPDSDYFSLLDGRRRARGGARPRRRWRIHRCTGSSSSHSSHSFNPIKWIKKDKGSKNSPDSSGTRSDVEKRLTPKLQAQGILPAKSNATEIGRASCRERV